MRSDVIEGIQSLLAKRASDLKRLNIEWFGGEPLIAKDVIYSISSVIQEIVRKNTDLVYRGSITTNGYTLDQDTLATLCDYGILSYQISLDGSEEVHDVTRLRADGAGTFRKIWSNLLMAQSTNFPFEMVLRVHYTPETWKKHFRLVDMINETFGSDARYKVFFKPVSKLGGVNDSVIKTFNHLEGGVVREELEGRLRHVGMVYHPSDEDICYASRANSFVIRANGDVGKCTVALYDPRNTVGKINQDGTMKLYKDRLIPWLSGLQTLDSELLECPLKQFPSLITLSSIQ
jgi:uncharacterized protein